MARAIIYRRVSTGGQAASGLGLEAQQQQCERHAGSLGLQIANVFTDAGISGTKPITKRPGLLGALTDLKRGDVLVIAKRDRLSRDQYTMLTIEREVERVGATLVSAAGEGTDGDGDAGGVGGLILRRVTDMISEVERELTRGRTKAALAAKKVRGELTGAPPFGFAVAPDGVTLIPNESERQLIRKVAGLRADGVTYRGIVERLNADGVTTRRGGKMQLRNVQYITRAIPTIDT